MWRVGQKQIRDIASKDLLSVLLDVAVGDLGMRPHITASAVCLYISRPEFTELGRSFPEKRLTLESNTYRSINRLIRPRVLITVN